MPLYLSLIQRVWHAMEQQQQQQTNNSDTLSSILLSLGMFIWCICLSTLTKAQLNLGYIRQKVNEM